jgi:hypothetical protein
MVLQYPQQDRSNRHGNQALPLLPNYSKEEEPRLALKGIWVFLTLLDSSQQTLILMTLRANTQSLGATTATTLSTPRHSRLCLVVEWLPSRRPSHHSPPLDRITVALRLDHHT